MDDRRNVTTLHWCSVERARSENVQNVKNPNKNGSHLHSTVIEWKSELILPSLPSASCHILSCTKDDAYTLLTHFNWLFPLKYFFERTRNACSQWASHIYPAGCIVLSTTSKCLCAYVCELLKTFYYSFGIPQVTNGWMDRKRFDDKKR